jgi:signal peptidase I
VRSVGILVWLVLYYLPLAVLLRRGRVRRAWIWVAASLLMPLLALITPWALLGALTVMLIALPVDAIRIARRSPVLAAEPAVPQAQIVPLRRPASRWVHLIAMVFLGVLDAVVIRRYVVEAFKIPSAGVEPSLVIGDRIFAEKLRLRLRGVERGELVVFPNPCTPHLDYIKRVVAVGGDRVEVRCGRLHVNGTAVPTEAVGPYTYDDYDYDRDTWYPQQAERWRERLGDRVHDVLHDPAATDHDFPRLDDAPDARFVCTAGDRRSPDERARAQGTVVASSEAPGGACAPQRQFVVPEGYVFTLGDNRENSADSRTWGPVRADTLTGIARSIWWSSGRTGVRWDRIGLIE